MRCWRCGKDNSEGVEKCLFCGISQSRTAPVTDTGKVFRKLYDDCGCEKIFEDSRYLTAPLSDFIPDSEILKSNIDLVFYVGIGKIYASQLQKQGKPDEDFYKRVKRVITEEADLSDRKADQLISYFDEMIGWKGAKTVAASSVQRPQEKIEPVVKDIYTEDADLSDRKAEQLISYSDEMIGWKDAKTVATSSVQRPREKVKPVVKDLYDEIEEFQDSEYINFLSNNSIEESVIPDEVNNPINSKTRPESIGYSYSPQKTVFSIERTEFLDLSEDKSTGNYASLESDKLLEGKTNLNASNIGSDSELIQPSNSIQANDSFWIEAIAFLLVAILIVVVIVNNYQSGSKQNSQHQSTEVTTNTSTVNTTETSSIETAKKIEIITFGSFDQDNKASNGKENIEWYVLTKESNKALVISKKVLTHYGNYFSLEEFKWEKSSLRKWLNKSFYNTAFSSEEKKRILSSNFDYGSDKIFLLSSTEVEKYLDEQYVRRGDLTNYAINKVDYEERSHIESGQWYWLLRNNYAVKGSTGEIEDYWHSYGGVRPAMWITLDS